MPTTMTPPKRLADVDDNSKLRREYPGVAEFEIFVEIMSVARPAAVRPDRAFDRAEVIVISSHLVAGVRGKETIA